MWGAGLGHINKVAVAVLFIAVEIIISTLPFNFNYWVIIHTQKFP